MVVLYRRLGTTYRSYFQGQEVQEEDVLTLENGTDRLSRNIGAELPLNAAQYPRRAQISTQIPTSRTSFMLLNELSYYANGLLSNLK